MKPDRPSSVRHIPSHSGILLSSRLSSPSRTLPEGKQVTSLDNVSAPKRLSGGSHPVPVKQSQLLAREVLHRSESSEVGSSIPRSIPSVSHDGSRNPSHRTLAALPLTSSSSWAPEPVPRSFDPRVSSSSVRESQVSGFRGRSERPYPDARASSTNASSFVHSRERSSVLGRRPRYLDEESDVEQRESSMKLNPNDSKRDKSSLS